MHRFTVQQVRLYCKFDLALHKGTFNAKKVAYPNGYDVFTLSWNRATDFTYRFSNLQEDNIVIRKRIDESRAQRQQKHVHAEEEKGDMVFSGLLDDDEELEQFDGMMKIRQYKQKKTGGREETPVAGPSRARRERAESVAESVVEVVKEKGTDAMTE
ncbi:hypothetical protein C8T65DRAFT_700225 [Cerioporus squamosus]|nr:hypothetical protein C8T65DRAFT_700225 [Cerioporus squamosus]